MAAQATRRTRLDTIRRRVYRLASRCQVCEKPILPGQTWKFTETGGKVHYYCARQNPAGPTFSQAMQLARQAGARIGDTSGFEPWLVKAKLETRSHAVKQRLEEEFWKGVEQGEAPKPKLESVYKGVRIFRSGEGFSTSLEPETIHDTRQDAKRFIDAQRNPKHGQRPGAFLEQIGNEHIRFPGFPQIVVTRVWLYRFLRDHGWDMSQQGIGSGNYMAWRALEVQEPLTAPELRDQWLSEPDVLSSLERRTA